MDGLTDKQKASFKSINNSRSPPSQINDSSKYPEHLQPASSHDNDPFGLQNNNNLASKPKTLEDIDNQVLPALKAGAGSNNPPEYAPGEEHLQDEMKNGEPIAADKRGIAMPLVDVFGEPVIRKIFSRTWNLREEGIGEVEGQIIG